MLDTTSKIVALIVASVGAITTIYDLFFGEERKRRQKYYTDLLKPFAIAYKEDPGIDPVLFVKNRVQREDDSIPKYIFLLVDEPNLAEELLANHKSVGKNKPSPEGALRKVLLYDYLSLYPNEYNKKRNIFEVVSIITDYVLVMMSLLFAVLGAFILTSGAIILISSLVMNMPPIAADCCEGIQYIVVGIGVIGAGFGPLRISEWLGNDMYSVKKEYLHKIIRKKILRYDKRHDKYVF